MAYTYTRHTSRGDTSGPHLYMTHFKGRHQWPTPIHDTLQGETPVAYTYTRHTSRGDTSGPHLYTTLTQHNEVSCRMWKKKDSQSIPECFCHSVLVTYHLHHTDNGVCSGHDLGWNAVCEYNLLSCVHPHQERWHQTR